MATKTPIARLIDDCRWRVRLLCADCKQQLNVTTPLTTDELLQNWTQIVLSGGLQAGACPNGCRSTYSDLNINTDLRIHDAETDVPVVLQTLQWLQGRFYAGDYGAVCRCRPRQPNELYRSARYPAIHGPCGSWLKPYRRAK